MPKTKIIDKIYFWKVRGEEYGCFSNFSPHSITVEGKRYSTSEHYYQSKKFEGTEYEEKVRTCSARPIDAFKMGKDQKLPIRKDWEDIKEDVMMKALKAKFIQHPQLKKKLIETGDKEIIEDSPYDSYWGIGKDKTGKNRLGSLLMELRTELLKDK
jgi:hypothetical protein